MRRRRARGTWFPIIGTGEAVAEAIAARSFSVDFPVNSANSITVITPVTFDSPQEGGTLDENDSMADIIGSEYVLQRIVGKAYIHRSQQQDPNGNDNGATMLVGAGFFVARANDAVSGGGEDTPIGSASDAERRDNYNVLGIKTTREPWIWRRTWILGTAGGNRGVEGVAGSTSRSVGNAGAVSSSYPASTTLYGSIADGPHIDSRVKRRVSQDNRLFLAVSAKPFPEGTETGGTLITTIQGTIEMRLYGSLRKARQTSAF